MSWGLLVGHCHLEKETSFRWGEGLQESPVCWPLGKGLSLVGNF